MDEVITVIEPTVSPETVDAPGNGEATPVFTQTPEDRGEGDQPVT